MLIELVLPFLSFCIKSAELDPLKCIDQSLIDNGSFVESIYNGLKQRLNYDQNHFAEDAQLMNLVCEFNKFHLMIESITVENQNPSCAHFSMDEFAFVNGRFTSLYHNDPPMSQVLTRLSGALVDAKRKMEMNENDFVNLIKTLKNHLTFALDFLAKRHGIQLDEFRESDVWEENGGGNYFLQEIVYFLDLTKKCGQSDKNCGPNCENDRKNGNDKNKERAKRFLKFVAKTIEIGTGDDGTAPPSSKRKKRAIRRRKRAHMMSFVFVLAVFIMAIFVLAMVIVCGLLWHEMRNNANNNINVVTDAVIIQMPHIAGISLANAFSQIAPVIVQDTIQETECAICFEPVCVGTSVRPLPQCQHIYHDNCIRTWIRSGHNACPICRHQIFDMPTTRAWNVN